jgi:radical SAM protein with 4Fe4S-binding SPASM domain
MKIFKFRDILPQVHNLLFRGRLRFKFEHLPFEARGITGKKKWNFVVAGLNQFFLPSRPLGYPVIAQVEPANVCNLDCPLCFTASKTSSRAPALLPFDTFKQFIDEVGDYLLLIVLWNWGEPFLNPDIFRIIEYAASKNILVHCSTNGNVVFTDETADRIAVSGLTSLVFGVDGADPATYRAYRKGGDLERVKENIRTLVRAKKRISSSTPLLTLRFVAMRDNEAELPLVEKMAHELGVDFFSIKSVDMPPELGNNLDQTYRPGKEKYRRYEYIDETYTRIKKPFVCMRPWKRITLDASGEVISCEYDYKNLHSFGQIEKGNSVLNLWKSAVSKTFRQNFHKGHNNFYHCKDCTYKDLRMEDCIIGAYPVCGHGQRRPK